MGDDALFKYFRWFDLGNIDRCLITLNMDNLTFFSESNSMFFWCIPNSLLSILYIVADDIRFRQIDIT
ncbi:hypothetical protein D3C76_1555680 [compost metagenome]